VGTTIKNRIIDGTIGHGAPGLNTLRMIIGMWTKAKLDCQPWERHSNLQCKETQERAGSRTGSESSQTGASATSGNIKSLEKKTLNKKEDCHSPTSKLPKSHQPPSVMPAPAPPSKGNVWVKGSCNFPAQSQSSDSEHKSPTSGGGKVSPAHPSEDGLSRKNEKKNGWDEWSKDNWKELDRKGGKWKDQYSRPAPDPKQSEGNPASKFSSASKYAALSPCMVKMRMRERTTPRRPSHLCFLLVSILEHSREKKSNLHLDKTK
ncbi:mCG140933, partial [Mus musculus]